MRAEYERLGRKQLEANVENLVRSKVRTRWPTILDREALADV